MFGGDITASWVLLLIPFGFDEGWPLSIPNCSDDRWSVKFLFLGDVIYPYLGAHICHLSDNKRLTQGL